jgi:hypothetical protein
LELASEVHVLYRGSDEIHTKLAVETRRRREWLLIW